MEGDVIVLQDRGHDRSQAATAVDKQAVVVIRQPAAKQSKDGKPLRLAQVTAAVSAVRPRANKGEGEERNGSTAPASLRSRHAQLHVWRTTKTHREQSGPRIA
eukprot:1150651-Prymnesium_polylepis.1